MLVCVCTCKAVTGATARQASAGGCFRTSSLHFRLAPSQNQLFQESQAVQRKARSQPQPCLCTWPVATTYYNSRRRYALFPLFPYTPLLPKTNLQVIFLFLSLFFYKCVLVFTLLSITVHKADTAAAKQTTGEKKFSSGAG